MFLRQEKRRIIVCESASVTVRKIFHEFAVMTNGVEKDRLIIVVLRCQAIFLLIAHHYC